tara:strand:- start:34716 stop:35207 length:492 start_codon:yes stop_codon:yes gene_type:complete
MNISKVLESSNVSRFHQVTGMTQQTIAQHSWGVSLLCQHLMPECSKDLILAALTHDCTELVTGDIPAPAKWAYPELKSVLDEIEEITEKEWGINFDLPTYEKRMLKLCDALEGMNYCIQRREVGELEAAIVFGKWANHIVEKFTLSEQEHDMFDNLIFKMSTL